MSHWNDQHQNNIRFLISNARYQRKWSSAVWIRKEFSTCKSRPSIKGEFSKNVHARSKINEHHMHSLFGRYWRLNPSKINQGRSRKMKMWEIGNRLTMRRESEGVFKIMVKTKSRITSVPQILSTVSPSVRRRIEGCKRNTAKKKVKLIKYLMCLTLLKAL